MYKISVCSHILAALIIEGAVCPRACGGKAYLTLNYVLTRLEVPAGGVDAIICCWSWLRPVNITWEELENGGFTLKTQQMFSVHITLPLYPRGKGKKRMKFRLTLHQRNFIWKRDNRRSFWICILSEFITFPAHTKTELKADVFKFLRFAECFRKALFRDWLVWTAAVA